MRRSIGLALLLTLAANGASINGRILDADSGQLITRTLEVEACTDLSCTGKTSAAGEFLVKGLVPALYRIQVKEPGNRFPIGEQIVTVKPGSDASPLTVYVRQRGSVAGFLRDEHRNPVPGAKVHLVAVEYWFGKLTYYARDRAITDDHGHYGFPQVDAGKSYLLLVLPPEVESPRTALAATWYPRAPATDSPDKFTVKSAEDKRIDPQITQAPSYCVDGTLTIKGRPGEIDFAIAIKETSGFVAATNTLNGEVRAGKSDPDGRFRACGLWPGEFRLITGTSQTLFGSALLSISNKDIHGIAVDAQIPVTMTGEVDWYPRPPDSPGKQTLSFTPVSRALTMYESPHQTAIDVPGSFLVELPAMTQYLVSIHGTPDNTYVKEIQCGGAALAGRVLDTAQAGCTVRVSVATDAGQVTLAVVDKQRKPVPNSEFCLVPLSARSKPEMMAGVRCAQTDAATASGSMPVPPGRYYAVARPQPQPLDWVENLWNRLTAAVVIDVAPRRSTHVALMLDSPGQ
ncbi:MAG: carboxypeptidase-like regulatory domain-containing protein [Bryobacteraceae bacterium]